MCVSSVFAAENTIQLTGTGTVAVTPDVAYIYLGVVTESGKVGKASADNKTAMSNLFKVLKRRSKKAAFIFHRYNMRGFRETVEDWKNIWKDPNHRHGYVYHPDFDYKVVTEPLPLVMTGIGSRWGRHSEGWHYCDTWHSELSYQEIIPRIRSHWQKNHVSFQPPMPDYKNPYFTEDIMDVIAGSGYSGLGTRHDSTYPDPKNL